MTRGPGGARRHEHCLSSATMASAARDRNKGTFARVSVCRAMKIFQPTSIVSGLTRAGRRVERPLRLVSGLILFAYATSHLVNHAFGIRSTDAVSDSTLMSLNPWQTLPGLTLLYTSFFAHGLLGLYAMDLGCPFRMERFGSCEEVLGLMIPLLLIPH